MKLVFERKFLGSPCLLECLIARKATQAFKQHCYLPLTWVDMTVENDVFSFLVHPSLHTCTSEGIKIGNLQTLSFYGPSSDQTPLRTYSSCSHFQKCCQGNPKQRRLLALKAGKCISTSDLDALPQIDSLHPFSNRSFKEQA